MDAEKESAGRFVRAMAAHRARHVFGATTDADGAVQARAADKGYSHGLTTLQPMRSNGLVSRETIR